MVARLLCLAANLWPLWTVCVLLQIVFKVLDMDCGAAGAVDRLVKSTRDSGRKNFLGAVGLAISEIAENQSVVRPFPLQDVPTGTLEVEVSIRYFDNDSWSRPA